MAVMGRSKRILLRNGEIQEYLVDQNSKAPIAQFRKDGKIWVNKKFEELTREQKLAIIYHERGHSKFILFRPLRNWIAPLVLVSFSILFFFSLLLLFINLLWVLGIITSLLLLLFYITIYWFLEIVADSNAVKDCNKSDLLKALDYAYKGKKFNLLGDWIMHPPIKLRKRIIERLD